MKFILWSLPAILCLMTSAPCGSTPTKLTPLKSEAQSQEYLAKPAKRGE